MAKVTKTYSELLMLVRAINIVTSSKEENASNNKGIKKLQKIGTKIKEHLDAYNDKLEDIRLDNANTDKDGSLLLDENGGYKFSKEGLKNLNKAVKELLDSTFEFYQFTFSNEGIENYGFLEGWVEGLEFPKAEAEVEELEVV